MNEESIDVTIGKYKFRIGRVSASIGTWIALRMRTADEEQFTQMQRHILRVCSLYNGSGASLPILMADGRWAEKELEFDTTTVAQLFTRAMDFNVGGFFAALASADKVAPNAG